jgi:hypothetical protein
MAPKTVVWYPLPGSQAAALCCPANHILYEGSRGPGKTDAQLMFFRKHVGLGYGQHWRGIIFDREYKNLDDLVAKSLRWFPQFKDGARFLQSKADYRWVWPTGEELQIRQIKRSQDYWKYHGQEFTFIGWNELTKFPTPELYDSMMSCNRSSFIPDRHTPRKEDGSYDTPNGKPLPEIPLVVFATTNPYGPGHGWVKKQFVDPVPPGRMVRAEREVFNPRTQQKEKVTGTQVRIFGSYRENKFLSPDYVATLTDVKDVNKRKAWLTGDWNIVAGGAFDDLWSEGIHVVPRFQIPAGWYVDRALDWGSSKPFSVGFWAIADGTEAPLPDGRVFCPPKGSLVRFGEWYGCDPNAHNTGLNLSARAVAQGTKRLQDRLLADRWVLRQIQPGPADSSIFDDSRKGKDGQGSDSIASEMEKEGITWNRADKSPGSRKNGLQLCRDRFENALTGEGKGIYIMEHCRAAIAQIPVLPRDPDDTDDVDSEAEDHLYDEMRYRVLAGESRAATKLDVKYA